MITALLIGWPGVYQPESFGSPEMASTWIHFQSLVGNVSRLVGSTVLTSQHLVLDELRLVSKECYKYWCLQRSHSDLFHRSKHHNRLIPLLTCIKISQYYSYNAK